ncbi:MAG: hypothetical protein AAB551_01665 [Patescibacteria group bacterium]
MKLEKTDLIDINQAAFISGKSIQTIRRAIKSKKIIARKQRTPQGFNYFISKKSVQDFFCAPTGHNFQDIPVEDMENHMIIQEAIQETLQEATQQTSQSLENSETKQEIKDVKRMLQSLIGQYQKEREQVAIVLKDIQDRVLVSENQIRFLSAPKKKWYQLWR